MMPFILELKHEPGQGMREGEGGNAARSILAMLLIATPCQQAGPADKQKYAVKVPSKCFKQIDC